MVEEEDEVIVVGMIIVAPGVMIVGAMITGLGVIMIVDAMITGPDVITGIALGLVPAVLQDTATIVVGLVLVVRRIVTVLRRLIGGIAAAPRGIMMIGGDVMVDVVEKLEDVDTGAMKRAGRYGANQCRMS